jgi:hypothetical protein
MTARERIALCREIIAEYERLGAGDHREVREITLQMERMKNETS